ncbi:MAG: hypothetical protein O3A31_09545 [Planctomycetota bacterium]|jgi:hypothetical protein|nr:hypothetical protein [Planctomycetota bacterium]
MASRRSTRSRRTSSPPSSSDEGLLVRITDRIGLGPRALLGCRVAGWFLFIAMIVAGGTLGIPSLRQRAMARDLQISSPIDVVFDAPPAWLLGDGTLHDELADTVRASIGEDRSPALRSGLERSKKALEQTGWFESVDQIQWIGPRTVRIDAIWVIPAALVRGILPGGEPRAFLVDSKGRRLENDYEILTNGLPELPVIKGASRSNPPSPGDRWGDDVDAALSLHAEIRNASWYGLIESIDVRRYLEDRELDLRTRRSTINWGRPPGNATIAEVSTRDKMKMLDYLVEIDALDTSGLVDIRTGNADLVYGQPSGG